MAEAGSREDYLVTEKLVKRFDEAVAVDEVNLSIGTGRDFCAVGQFRLRQVHPAAHAGRV